MKPLESYSEEVGQYGVEYLRIDSAVMGHKLWIYRAKLLDSAPFPLPAQKCGNARTLSEARNSVREAIPGSPWRVKWAGISDTEA